MKIDKERERFEAWYVDHFASQTGREGFTTEILSTMRGDEGDYRDYPYIHGAWAGFRAARAALDEQKARPSDETIEGVMWQPIETAPRDGSTILLRGKGDHRIADGYWLQAAYNGNGAWVWPYVHSEPMKWMPVPADAQRAKEPT